MHYFDVKKIVLYNCSSSKGTIATYVFDQVHEGHNGNFAIEQKCNDGCVPPVEGEKDDTIHMVHVSNIHFDYIKPNN